MITEKKEWVFERGDIIWFRYKISGMVVVDTTVDSITCIATHSDIDLGSGVKAKHTYLLKDVPKFSVIERPYKGA